jgi:hypothetical protein
MRREVTTIQDIRISFRQPVSAAGYVDAAWWPRGRDLTSELPALLDVLWSAGREITRVTYNLGAWDRAPRRIVVDGRSVRLGGFLTSEPSGIRLSDPWGHERVDILVIPPATDPAVAERALRLASEADSVYRGADILALAAGPPEREPST